jgi:hypothetical protein
MGKRTGRKLNDFNLVRPLPGDPDLIAKAVNEGERLGKLIGMFTCEENSIILAKVAMEGASGADVVVVAGFAYPGHPDAERPDLPRAHVWVRIDNQHIDISWSRRGHDPITGQYYAAFEERVTAFSNDMPELNILNRLNEIAVKRGLELL